MSYEVVIESSCDLNRENRVKFGIYPEIIRGVVYIPGRPDEYSDNEFKNFSEEEFFKIVKKNAGKVHTAFAPYEEFVRVVEPILKSGKDALVLTLSTGISGTYNGLKNWGELLLEDYPQRHIIVVDTLRYSSASGLLAIYAAKNRDKGMSLEENAAWCNEHRHCIHEAGPMDDLSFLSKNGRLSAGKAFFGGLVGVQPFAEFTRDGKNQPLGTIKGDARTNEVSIQYLLKTARNLEDQVVIIAHSRREKRALEFKEQLLKVAKPKEVIIHHVGQSCGPNVGPGLCAYFYMGDPITESRSAELAIFEEIKNQK